MQGALVLPETEKGGNAWKRSKETILKKCKKLSYKIKYPNLKIVSRTCISVCVKQDLFVRKIIIYSNISLVI